MLTAFLQHHIHHQHDCNHQQHHRRLCPRRQLRSALHRHPPFQHLLLLLPLLSLFHPVVSFCPSKCQCLVGDASRTYCVDAALEDVPIQLNPETKYINLTLNKIRNLEFTLPFYTKLEVLDLSQNIIETLGSKNFEYQSELRTLNLSRNSVSSLQRDAFRGLTSLLLLDLSYNRIEMVHPTAMHDLTALIELDLTNNNIVSLEDNCFRNMLSLEILIFKNNQLLDVPANNLQHLHALKSLDLSVNLVEYIRNESFEGLRELLMLSLRGNVISELDLGAFEGLLALKHMDLADNNLTFVPTQQLSRLSNLTYLSLSGNRFSQLPAVALLNLFHLKELHLNRLDRLTKIDSRMVSVNVYLGSIVAEEASIAYEVPEQYFFPHPAYNATKKINDVALIQIPKTTECDKIRYARLPLDSAKYPSDMFESETAIIMGWGLKRNNDEISEYLQKAKVEVMTTEDCQLMLPYITEKDLCVKTSKPFRSICNGDSGGPLVLEESGELIGIASFIPNTNCENGAPNIFMRATSYLPWIIQSIGGLHY